MLWQIQLAALALGVIMLSTLDPLASEAGATLIAATNLFQVGFLWFVSYDVARHRTHQIMANPATVTLTCWIK